MLVGCHGEHAKGTGSRALLFKSLTIEARERSGSGVADEDDARVVATEIVLEVVAHAAARTHARPGQKDGVTMDAVDRDGIGRLTREMQARHGERIVALLQQLHRFRIEALRMASEYLGSRDRRRGIEVDLRRCLEPPLRDTLAQEVLISP